jgi:hypothetical protein
LVDAAPLETSAGARMASTKQVIATYGRGWKPGALVEEDARVDRALPAEWGRVMDYDDIDALVSLTALELDLDPDHPCLSLLEIDAHGCPSSLNDIYAGTIDGAATKLMTLKWCDAGDIYLCGCNTGNGDPQASEPRPIAELLAKAMKYDASTFPHRITVHGSLGYLSGTHMAGTERTTGTYRDGGVDFTRPGARAATGNDCWTAYHNW